MAKKRNQKKERPSFSAKLNLSGITADDQYPEMVVYALDRSGKLLSSGNVDKDGKFNIPTIALKKAYRISIGPKVEDFSKIDKKNLSTYRTSQFKQLIEKQGFIEVPKKIWHCWRWIRLCVSGSVKHCSYWPFYLSKTALSAKSSIALTQSIRGLTNIDSVASPITDYEIAKPHGDIFRHYRCRTVCDGYIEVYRRNCCCYPWIIYDPRLPDLVRELERIVYEVPKIKWPRPQPDPVPFEEIPFLKGGTLDLKTANAKQDLEAIQTLPSAEVVEYIKARPYLYYCTCSTPTKVADGFINPDGEFHICWWDCIRLMLINCHDEYAFVIKQNIDDSTVTIYDGVTAGQWFHYGDHADLTSYHRDTIICREPDFPGEAEGAFAVLQDIGDTGSWNLKTPNAKGWDRVNAPVDYNDGLVFPAANASAAKGKYKDRNWGGTLKLRYHFSEAMNTIGAKYYRVSVVAADSNGNPTGDRKFLEPKEWKYYEVIGTDIYTRKVSLGPDSKGGNNHLYEIPYDSDPQDWQSGQYHALLDTTKYSNGRFLVTLEVFNSAGQLLRPTGTPNPGGSIQRSFTYRRWYQETGPTAEVPFAGLTHMLWWDNRKAIAEIEDFRVNGIPNTGECQFLEGPDSSNFSVGYRAYHPQPMFLLNHVLWWRRGLSGTTGYLTSPPSNPDNVGMPFSTPHQSISRTFSTMLGPHTKCAFSINLHTNVKTFNGEVTLNGLDGWDQASMALGIGTGVIIGS